jgi:hypothetical protein
LRRPKRSAINESSALGRRIKTNAHNVRKSRVIKIFLK